MVNLLIGIVLAIILFELNTPIFILGLFLSLFIVLAFLKKEKIYLFMGAVFLFVIVNCNLISNMSNIDKIQTKATVIATYTNNENKYLIKNKGLRLILYTKDKIEVGDVIRVDSKLENIAPKLNRSDFDYKKYLKSENIAGIIESKSVEKIGESFYYKQVKYFSDFVYKNLHNLLEKDNADLMSAVMLSDTGYLSTDKRDVYSQLGLSHVLAMSGLHIGLIMMIIEGVLKLFPIGKILRRVLSLLVTFIYIMLIGFPVGALRAFLMAGLLFLSFIWKEKYSTEDGLIFSAIIILIINPFSVYSISFSLSFLSVLGIVLFYDRMCARIGKNIISSSISLTLAVSIMILPISLYYFGSFSMLGIISNLIVLPLISLSIVLSYFMLILLPVSFVIAPSVNILMNLSDLLIDNISKIDFLMVHFRIYFIELSCIYISIYLFFKIKHFKDYYLFNKAMFTYICLSLFFGILISANKYINTSEINFIYVDQGDCAIIRDKNVYSMVDTGGSRNKDYRVGKRYTLNYLRSKGIKVIDNLFISHYDEDHIEGLMDIIDEIKIKNIYVPYVEDNEYTRAILSRNIKLFDIEEEDVVPINKNTYFKCLFDGDNFADSNDKSMVLLRNDRGFKTLFTGDVEHAESVIKEDVDFLKVSHHGSRTSTSLDFLNRISPKYASISSGFENSYSHPHDEVLENLSKANVKYFNTAKDGEIALEIDNKSVKFYSYTNVKTNYYLFAIIIIASVLIGCIFIRGEYFAIQRHL